MLKNTALFKGPALHLSYNLVMPCNLLRAQSGSIITLFQIPATDSSLSAPQPSENSPSFSQVEVHSCNFLSLDSLTNYWNMMHTHFLADLSTWIWVHFPELRYCTFPRAQISYFFLPILWGIHYFVGDVPQEQSALPCAQWWLGSYTFQTDIYKKKPVRRVFLIQLLKSCLFKNLHACLSTLERFSAEKRHNGPRPLLFTATSESKSGS